MKTEIELDLLKEIDELKRKLTSFKVKNPISLFRNLNVVKNRVIQDRNF